MDGVDAPPQPIVDLFSTMPRPFGAVGGPPRALLCPASALPECLVRVAPAGPLDAAALPEPMSEPLRFGSRSKLVTLYRDYALTVVCDMQPSVGALDPATMRFHYDTMVDTLEKTVRALAAPCTFTVSGITWRVCCSLSITHTHTHRTLQMQQGVKKGGGGQW